ncbi:MAG: elongation factor G [bacterium]|nr:elongation factor G [bacterium]
MVQTSKIRNTALISHGGAGKTSLTEAILFNTKVTTRLGRVEEGNTVSDYDPDEVKRRMSINSTLVHTQWDGDKINLIDTPGYADFVGEVVSTLQVVDSCILVCDAVSGVEVGTELVWEYADKYGLPRIIFINKLDKENADPSRVVDDLKTTFSAPTIPIQIPIGKEANFKGVVDLIRNKALIFTDGKVKEEAVPSDLADEVAAAKDSLVEAVAETDDDLLEQYLEEGKLSDEQINQVMKTAIAQRKIIPVLYGSAYHNIGIQPLLDFIRTELPAPDYAEKITLKNPDTEKEEERKLSPDVPFSARVFKVITDPFVGELTFFRVYSGVLHAGSDVFNSTRNHKERIGHICVMEGKERKDIGDIGAGDIASVVKLKGTKTGDTLCDAAHPVIFDPLDVPETVISLAVAPRTAADQEKLSMALHRLSEEDTTLKVYYNKELRQTIIQGMGEVHLELALDRMIRKFGVEIEVEKPKIAYRETIRKSSKGEKKYKKQSGGRGQYGHCLLEIEPLPTGSEFQFENKLFGGSIPSKYVPAIEKGVKEAMEKGVLAGYPVIDTKVILYDGSFHTVDSSDMAFQIAGSFAFKNAFEGAGAVLLEPVMEVEVKVAKEYMGDIIGDLNSRRGKIQGMEEHGGSAVVKVVVPEAEMYKYSTSLRSITHGRGTYKMKFSHYEEVPHQLAEAIIEESKKEE